MTNRDVRFLENNIDRENGDKDGVYVWIGEPSKYMKALRILWRNWNTESVNQHRQESDLHNMHNNPMCCDRRYITDSPEEWKEARK